jgi:hypothetical protein
VILAEVKKASTGFRAERSFQVADVHPRFPLTFYLSAPIMFR